MKESLEPEHCVCGSMGIKINAKLPYVAPTSGATLRTLPRGERDRVLTRYHEIGAPAWLATTKRLSKAAYRAMNDKTEIIDIVNQYFAALDKRTLDLETFRRIFADKATVERPNGTRMTGPEEISSSHANSLERFRATQHLTSGCIIDLIDESNADFRVNLVAMHLWKEGLGDKSVSKQDNFFLAGGVISGSVIKTRKGWRISKLRNDPIWIRGVGFQEMISTK
jgi:hypothetical protein